VHVDQAFRASPFVQIIDILRHDQQPARPFGIEPREGPVRGIRFDVRKRRAPIIVKSVDQIGIGGQSFGRAHVFNPVPFPQAAGTAKGRQPAFGRYARPCQNHDVVDVTHSLAIDYVMATGKTRIAIFGSAGRMGQAIAKAAENADCTHGGVDIGGDAAALAKLSDVIVDFSSPDALTAHLTAARFAKTPILIGTTGLDGAHQALIDDAASEIAVLQAANTSLGINLLSALIEQATARLGDDWDIEIVEMHHRHKIDAPSGTALLLGQAAARGRGKSLPELSRFDRDGLRDVGSIGFASLRGGSVAGDHMVVLASDGERIELSHRAEDRSIFAKGAVKAATWLIDKPARRYSMADVLEL
jgi:4-hydroxy-tetrahydrodipicolinate reductase